MRVGDKVKIGRRTVTFIRGADGEPLFDGIDPFRIAEDSVDFRDVRAADGRGPCTQPKCRDCEELCIAEQLVRRGRGPAVNPFDVSPIRYDTLRGEPHAVVTRAMKDLREVYVLNQTELATWQDHSLGRMVLQIKGYIAALPAQSYQHPADWWEALKQRWFPRWALRRWPVRLHTLKLYTVCPHLQFEPKHQHIEWMFARQEER